MDENSSIQFSIFKDCIAQKLLHLTSTPSDITEDEKSSTASNSESPLDDFSSYLATEAWETLPNVLKEATHETRDVVPDPDALSLDSLSTSFTDSLVSYGVVNDVDDATNFLRKIIGEYISQTCAPPPAWSSTRTENCEMCGRTVPLTYHHLIPRSTHTKVLKQGWHPKAMLNSVAWLCRPCHSVVHHVASNEDLARYFHTVELLMEREDIQKWQKYATKQRFGIRRG
ncbi:Putative protein YisB [Psilocybe cubensis]|uniref:HNH domain-containing protein n=2 Tax=Psilocybe cubensis TaxID=181762 RepID=A0A8H7XQL7_PSICU|nr:Putative protein YisB [Psilocybe cubensis]KAH9475512.1 Putative protein YisB [Psilocybe cubensis]